MRLREGFGDNAKQADTDGQWRISEEMQLQQLQS